MGIRRMSGWFGAGAAAAVLFVGAARASAQGGDGPAVVRKVTMTASEAWEKGMGGAGVQHAAKGDGVTLYDTALIEDDGPGSGSDAGFHMDEDRSPVVSLSGQTIAKKVFVVDRPSASVARVYARAGLEVEVNGKAIGKTSGSKIATCPPELLKKGENVVIFRYDGNDTADFKVAARRHILQNAPERKDRPARSFLSEDGGATWKPIDGELTARLSLLQYPEEGFLISPVIDLAGGEANGLPLSGASLRSVRLAANGDTPAGTSVHLFVRTGAGPVYEAGKWSDWAAPKGVAAPKGHRFLQWKAVLKTADGKVTPLLRYVIMEATVERQAPPPWAGQLALVSLHNEEILYTAMPFEYEDPNHPRMVALRQKYKLDEVVKDGNTELEKLILLRNWVKNQWKYKPAMNVKYPAWDADEILTRKIGFCVQFAVTYVQCCAALGYPARFVFGYHPGGIAGSGHEVTEVWSNQFGKWIFMDPEGNRHYVDPRTNEPLSMLESHDRMLRTYYGDKPVNSANKPKDKKWSDEIIAVGGTDIVPPKVYTSADPPPKSWPAWTKWAYIRYMPRNNWYSRPFPIPRIQGWGGWEWPGFYAWYDKQVPHDWRYGNFTNRRTDLEWTINQVRFAASWGDRSGLLDLQLGTVTPNFDTYLVNVDGQGWKKCDGKVAWELHAGRNRIELRVRNTSGVQGPVSHVEVEYKP